MGPKHKDRKLLLALGARIKLRRKSLGLTQEQVAEAAGFDHTYVGYVERGERNISVVYLKRIAKALDTIMADLLKGL